jgi:hypothetical protein
MVVFRDVTRVLFVHSKAGLKRKRAIKTAQYRKENAGWVGGRHKRGRSFQ